MQNRVNSVPRNIVKFTELHSESVYKTSLHKYIRYFVYVAIVVFVITKLLGMQVFSEMSSTNQLLFVVLAFYSLVNGKRSVEIETITELHFFDDVLRIVKHDYPIGHGKTEKQVIDFYINKISAIKIKLTKAAPPWLYFYGDGHAEFYKYESGTASSTSYKEKEFKEGLITSRIKGGEEEANRIIAIIKEETGISTVNYDDDIIHNTQIVQYPENPYNDGEKVEEYKKEEEKLAEYSGKVNNFAMKNAIFLFLPVTFIGVMVMMFRPISTIIHDELYQFGAENYQIATVSYDDTFFWTNDSKQYEIEIPQRFMTLKDLDVMERVEIYIQDNEVVDVITEEDKEPYHKIEMMEMACGAIIPVVICVTYVVFTMPGKRKKLHDEVYGKTL